MALVGCGDEPTVVGTGGGTGGDTETTAADAAGDDACRPPGCTDTDVDEPPDTPPPASSCESQGLRFDFLGDPVVVLPIEEGDFVADLGFLVGETGMLVTYEHAGAYEAIRAVDGLVAGSPFAIPTPGSVVWATATGDTLLLAHCGARLGPRWLALDEFGQSLGPQLVPSGAGTCLGSPTGTATSERSYLLAWMGGGGTDDCVSCQWIADATPSAVATPIPLRPAGDPGAGVAIAAGPRSVLSVQLPTDYTGIELMLTDLEGSPLFPPLHYDNAETIVGELPLRAPAVGATDDGDFIVAVAGYAGGLGIMRLDEIASVLEDFRPIDPLPELLTMQPSYPFELRLTRRPGGFVATLPIMVAGQPGSWLLLLDDEGVVGSQQFVPGAWTMRVGIRGELGWALLDRSDGLAIAPMGCV